MLSAMDAAKPDFEMDERDQPQWCNWYRSLTTHDANGTIRHAGDEWPGQSVYASQEEAERAAWTYYELREMVREDDETPEGDPTVYLGARPVGDDNA